MSEPYKFTTKMTDDYILEVQATPDIGAVTQLYRQLAAGIDHELIRNMPEHSIVKLLEQLLDAYLNNPTYIAEHPKHHAFMLLLDLKAEYGI